MDGLRFDSASIAALLAFPTSSVISSNVLADKQSGAAVGVLAAKASLLRQADDRASIPLKFLREEVKQECCSRLPRENPRPSRWALRWREES